MFAIQVAKQAGAHVTGVDNAARLEHMRALGADEVLDHRREDFTRHGPFDLVLDLVATRSVLDCRRALAPGGRYRCVGGPVPTVLSVLTVGAVVGLVSGIGVLAVRPGPAHFGPLAERCARGDLHPRRAHLSPGGGAGSPRPRRRGPGAGKGRRRPLTSDRRALPRPDLDSGVTPGGEPGGWSQPVG